MGKRRGAPRLRLAAAPAGGAAACRVRVPDTLPAAGAFERGNAGASSGLSRGFRRARREGAGTASPLGGGFVADGVRLSPAAALSPPPLLEREPVRSVPGWRGKGLGPWAAEKGAEAGGAAALGSFSSLRRARAGSVPAREGVRAPQRVSRRWCGWARPGPAGERPLRSAGCPESGTVTLAERGLAISGETPLKASRPVS